MVAARIVKYGQIVVLIYLSIYLFIFFFLVLIAVWGSYFISFLIGLLRITVFFKQFYQNPVSTVQICKSPNFFIHYCVSLALLCGS